MSTRSHLLDLKQELEWRRCSKDELYFLENYWFIQNPRDGRVLFKLREAQQEALKNWAKDRYSLTLKARQIGWTTLVSAHQFWKAWFHDDENIIDISRTEREAVLLLRKTKYGHKNLPKWMLDRGPQNVVEHQQKMAFTNGSQITSMPSASDPARGESATLIVVDEWAFLPNPEEAWASIEPVADVGGRIIGLSTANGSGNFFHGLWVGATAGNNQFKTMFYPWSANEERGEDWYAVKKRSMLPWQLAQEYPSNPEEAFIKSGRTVFDVDDLVQKVVVVEPERGYLQELNSLKNLQWRPNGTDLNPDDPIRVWELPQSGSVYVVGADTAEGLDWGDYSSAHVINVGTGQVVAMWHGHIPADLFGEELFKLGLFYNDALMGVESNNHGLTTITSLRRLGYKRMFRRRRLNSAQGRTPTMEFGWQTSKTTKPLMIDELAMSLREEEISLSCAETLAELRTFTRDDHGRMSGSPYDDRVISLSIANQMLRYAYAPEYAEREDPYLSFQWWANLEHGGEQATNEWRIGANNARSRR